MKLQVCNYILFYFTIYWVPERKLRMALFLVKVDLKSSPHNALTSKNQQITIRILFVYFPGKNIFFNLILFFIFLFSSVVSEFTLEMILIVAALLLGVACLANMYTWTRMLKAIFFSQRRHLQRSIAKLETLKSEGFLQTLRLEVRKKKITYLFSNQVSVRQYKIRLDVYCVINAFWCKIISI